LEGAVESAQGAPTKDCLQMFLEIRAKAEANLLEVSKMMTR
jgi:hypothetical protein